jgi:hypothetical protein
MSGDTLSKEFLQSLARPVETPEAKAAREHESRVRITVESIRSGIFDAATRGLTSYTVHAIENPQPDQHSFDPSLFTDVYAILQQEAGNVPCTMSEAPNGNCIHFDWS